MKKHDFIFLNLDYFILLIIYNFCTLTIIFVRQYFIFQISNDSLIFSFSLKYFKPQHVFLILMVLILAKKRESCSYKIGSNVKKREWMFQNLIESIGETSMYSTLYIFLKRREEFWVFISFLKCLFPKMSCALRPIIR